VSDTFQEFQAQSAHQRSDDEYAKAVETFQPAKRLSDCECNDENAKSSNQPEHLLERSFRWFHFGSMSVIDLSTIDWKRRAASLFTRGERLV
jgi:hypothetical protein